MITRRKLIAGASSLIASPALAWTHGRAPSNTMQIVFVPQPNWAGAPTDYKTAVQTAANMMMAACPNVNCQINISLEYTTLQGFPISPGTSGSADNSTIAVAYGTIKAAMQAISNPTSVLTTTINNLPAGSTLGGQSSFFISNAICKLLGMYGITDGPTGPFDPAIDGFIGMGTSWSPTKTVGVCLHELVQAMGVGTQRATYNFTRLKSPGVWDAGSAAGSYFSIDGGTTNLVVFDATQDPADFVDGTIDPGSGLSDCFNVTQTNPLQALSPLDIIRMQSLGFR